MTPNTNKPLLVILSQSPYNGSLAREAIDYCLAAAAFEQHIQLLFIGDGVLQLLTEQRPESISQKNVAKTLSALPIYGIDKLFVDQEALDRYGLSDEQLCLPISKVTPSQMADMLANATHTLNF